MSSLLRARRGVSALEFVLTLPFLLAVVFGIVELSLFMHRSQVITRVARDSCRIGSGVLEGPQADGTRIRRAAIKHATFALDAAGVDCGDGCDLDAEWFEHEGWMMLRVTVGVPYEPFTAFLPLIPKTTTGDFVMMTQQQVFDEG